MRNGARRPGGNITTAHEYPTGTGTYALLTRLDEPTRLTVGRLGTFTFPAGDYVYVGSAFGPGGLRARLLRHTRPAAAKRMHWHVDSLLSVSRLVGMYWEEGARRSECDWVQRLLQLPDAQVPVPGFGSSDCRAGCPAHLLHFPSGISIERIRETMMLLPGLPYPSRRARMRLGGCCKETLANS
ncbi:MAG TPA: GIY-YIG nuclease family protein [Anaerolineae bacterium]|nr:GIY-YIG nuclease family protein [Anaerolineae bacterium]